MKTLLILFLSLTSLSASADFIFTPGATVTGPYQSAEENLAGKEVVDANTGAGLLVNLDWIVFSPLTIGIGLGYQARSATVQYKNFFATANDLDAAMIQLTAEAGAKLRFINLKRFKTFIGGGLTVGVVSFTFNENKFESITGSSNGFEESESQSYSGIYLDAGFEYIFSNSGGLRLSGKYVEMETQEFVNLDNQSLTIDYFSVALQYMHYVNWDFFWK